MYVGIYRPGDWQCAWWQAGWHRCRTTCVDSDQTSSCLALIMKWPDGRQEVERFAIIGMKTNERWTHYELHGRSTERLDAHATCPLVVSVSNRDRRYNEATGNFPAITRAAASATDSERRTRHLTTRRDRTTTCAWWVHGGVVRRSVDWTCLCVCVVWVVCNVCGPVS